MDDILLFGLIANAKNPAELEVVGDSLQVEPYACMLRKDDPAFKKLVDGTIVGLMKTGEFEKMYARWFLQPIPPKGVTLNLPMSAAAAREHQVAERQAGDLRQRSMGPCARRTTVGAFWAAWARRRARTSCACSSRPARPARARGQAVRGPGLSGALAGPGAGPTAAGR